MYKSILLFLLAAFAFSRAASQNVQLNILTRNSGEVNQGEIVFLEVTICNTSSSVTVPVYKLRPQINFPAAMVNVPDTGNVLPAGWKIISSTEGILRLSNGTDAIPARECRTILIAMHAKAIGGPSTIMGNLLFSNGSAPGSESGSATPGDSPADNASASTIKVLK